MLKTFTPTRLLRSSSLSSSLEGVTCFFGFFAGRAGEEFRVESEGKPRPLDESNMEAGRASKIRQDSLQA